VLPPIVVTAGVVAAGLAWGAIPGGRLLSGLAPLWLAALGIGVFNALFSGSNADPSLPTAFVLGPFRVTWAAIEAGAGLAMRVIAIAAVGVVFGQTTDSTRLVDGLVQQARVPERFGYGALAAYQAIPRLADQLTTLRQARRIRGLRGSWHPRILVGLLVLAIRHGDACWRWTRARPGGGRDTARWLDASTPPCWAAGRRCSW
jgi:energy-coupling factor transporter transmembrane protein EcfT